MKTTLENITPGEILSEDFLKPLDISQARFAAAIGLPASRVSEIVNGRQRITAEYAIRFARFWGTSPEFWLNLQAKCDLEAARESAKAIKKTVPTVRQYLRGRKTATSV